MQINCCRTLERTGSFLSPHTVDFQLNSYSRRIMSLNIELFIAAIKSHSGLCDEKVKRSLSRDEMN